MEILTALQWAKKGFIPNEGAEGTEREEKRKQNAEYREKMKTHWQWLQEGRIPDPHARWRVGEELNRIYNTCSYGSKYCYCHEKYTHEPKNDEEIQKAILDFHKNGDSWG